MKKLIVLSIFTFCSLQLFALNPSKDYPILPSEYGMDYKEVRIPATDGVMLNAWVFKPSSESKKFIIMSDDGNGNMGDNIEIAAQFLSIGYNVLMYDYRGFGKSDSFAINKKFFIYPQFTKDIIGVIEYTRKYHTTIFDLYGMGMGAGLSLSVGANRPEVRRIIADGGYASFEQTKARYKEKKNEDVLMPLAYDKMFMEPQYALAEKGNQLFGILYIVGEKDELFSPADVKALIKVHPKNTATYIVPGVTSDADFATNKNEYFNQIKKFIQTHGAN